jgi:hypothetical protein
MCIQGSVLFGETRIPSGFVTYFAKNMTTKVFLRDATEVPLYALLLFGGKVTVNRQSPQGPLPFRPARLAFFFSDYMPSVLSLLNESLFRADFASGRTSLPRDLPSVFYRSKRSPLLFFRSPFLSAVLLILVVFFPSSISHDRQRLGQAQSVDQNRCSREPASSSSRCFRTSALPSQLHRSLPGSFPVPSPVVSVSPAFLLTSFDHLLNAKLA